MHQTTTVSMQSLQNKILAFPIFSKQTEKPIQRSSKAFFQSTPASSWTYKFLTTREKENALQVYRQSFWHLVLKGACVDISVSPLQKQSAWYMSKLFSTLSCHKQFKIPICWVFKVLVWEKMVTRNTGCETLKREGSYTHCRRVTD